MKKTFTKTHSDSTTATFHVLIEHENGKTNWNSETYFTTREAAGESGKKAVEDWGSNLVYLGASPVEINRETYFENGFNVWD